MNLYVTLQAVLDKIRDNNDQVVYSSTEGEKLRKVLDNQERLAEGMLLIGGLLQALIEKEISVQLIPDRKEDLQ